MNDILILGGTGKTGSRLAAALTAEGQPVRTAARKHADVTFDWDEPDARRAALEGADRVYLVPPQPGQDFLTLVEAFLDEAAAAGVRHVTALSAFGIDAAPDEVPLRAMELALTRRDDLTSTIIRPAWFMQNYSEGFYAPQLAAGTLALPAGEGVEAFIDAADIAAVAAKTLIAPDAHAGRSYDITGPEAITQAELARQVSLALGREITYVDVDPEAWQAGLRDAGVSPEQTALLGRLLETIRSGHGTRPNGTVRDVIGREPRSFDAFLAEAIQNGAFSERASA